MNFDFVLGFVFAMVVFEFTTGFVARWLKSLEFRPVVTYETKKDGSLCPCLMTIERGTTTIRTDLSFDDRHMLVGRIFTLEHSDSHMKELVFTDLTSELVSPVKTFGEVQS
jgi:hypothetical protein